MDYSKQLYETEATGWKRGLYEDIKHTFRAPIVNWVFRTPMANHPEFLRYMWPQVKPIFQTKAFGSFSLAHRDTVLTALEAEMDLPTFRREEVDISPAEFGALRSQLATFDVVAPRLAVLFEIVDRSLHGEPVGTSQRKDRSRTDPLPLWLDADRGTKPSMIDFDDRPEAVEATIQEIQRFHGFEADELPSIYRCLAQWPSFLDTAWSALRPIFDADAFDDACRRGRERVTEFADQAPYRPALRPEQLRLAGIDDEAIDDMSQLFREFNRSHGGQTVVFAIPVYAATVDVAGLRSPL